MPEYIPTREDALKLLNEYNKSESLIKHAFAVESIMRYFAEKYNEDVDKWGIIGLVHDIDYEKYPFGHCQKCVDIFKENNWPKDYIRAVVSHGWEICSDTRPEHIMEKVLYAIDELSGLIIASMLVRPSKSILDLKVKSVKKKWKDKRFSAGVDRSIIEKGAAMLNLDIDELIYEIIYALKMSAEELELKGNL